eukprot:2828122-Prymnesium_polylepis.1
MAGVSGAEALRHLPCDGLRLSASYYSSPAGATLCRGHSCRDGTNVWRIIMHQNDCAETLSRSE